MNQQTKTPTISAALQIFFSHVEVHRSLKTAPPPGVEKAFREIVVYYTPRLRAALNLNPCDRLYCPELLYNYCWTQLWRFGHKITQNRTPAGVFLWLKRTLHHRQLQIWKLCSREKKLMFYLDDYLGGKNGFDRTTNEITQAISQMPQLGKLHDASYRFNLLYEHYEAALARLNERQRQIIQLSKLSVLIEYYQKIFNPRDAPQESVIDLGKEHSLEEIKEIMGFSSIDAVKSFKSRAFRVLVKELIRMFKREISQTHGDIDRREILEEWLAHYDKSGTPGNR